MFTVFIRWFSTSGDENEAPLHLTEDATLHDLYSTVQQRVNARSLNFTLWLGNPAKYLLSDFPPDTPLSSVAMTNASIQVQWDEQPQTVLDEKAPLPPEAFVDDGYDSPRFDLTDPREAKQGLAFFNAHGYIVVASVLAPPEVQHAHAMFWDWVRAHAPGCNADDMNTWEDAWFADSETGLVNSQGIGQSDFLWFRDCAAACSVGVRRTLCAMHLIIYYTIYNIFPLQTHVLTHAGTYVRAER